MNVSNCVYASVREAARSLGWRTTVDETPPPDAEDGEEEEEKEAAVSKRQAGDVVGRQWHLFWTDSSVTPERGESCPFV